MQINPQKNNAAIVCTLFEGTYHFGLGVLANSLYANGFRGTICVGYRGELPPWAANAKKFDGFAEFTPAEGLALRFIPLATKIHLTNYKPDFMLEVWKKHFSEARALFYFDPDITIKCRWTFFEEWAQDGVALCEDVNSPMPSTHPLRNAWRHFYGKLGRKLPNNLEIYVNGGFAGVTLERKPFIEEWQKIQEEMSSAAGDMMGWGLLDRTFKFCFTDQDALNITLMNTTMPFSLSGKDGMDIDRMGFLMSHALGPRKPWLRCYLWERFSKGFSVGFADRAYWSNVKHPIALYSPLQRTVRWLDLMGTVAIDRII